MKYVSVIKHSSMLCLISAQGNTHMLAQRPMQADCRRCKTGQCKEAVRWCERKGCRGMESVILGTGLALQLHSFHERIHRAQKPLTVEVSKYSPAH